MLAFSNNVLLSLNNPCSLKKVTNQISLQSCNDSNLYNKSAGDTQEGRKEKNATLINLLFSLLTLHLQKMEVHSCVGCRDREQRDPMVVSERLYGLVGIEIEVVIVLVDRKSVV